MECPACHTQNLPDARFCAQCGAPLPSPASRSSEASSASYVPPSAGYTEVPAGAVPPPGYTPPPPGYGHTSSAYAGGAPVTGASGGLSASTAAAVAYITIIPAILFLVLEPYNRLPLVRFHSFQSICFAVAWFIVWVIITVLHIALHFIPLIGIIFFLVDAVVAIGFLVFWIMAIIRASKGEFYKLPIIGDIALRQVQQS